MVVVGAGDAPLDAGLRELGIEKYIARTSFHPGFVLLSGFSDVMPKDACVQRCSALLRGWGEILSLFGRMGLCWGVGVRVVRKELME
eukprot:168902-Amorphochlora_amoeboformis.AAC.1